MESSIKTTQTIALTGGTGFVGKVLHQALLDRGYQVRLLSRIHLSHPPDWLLNCDAVIHLAGATVSAYWTTLYKRTILHSRIDGPQVMATFFERLGRFPKVWISASAIGIYGDRGDEILTVESEAGNGFLSDVCRKWEASAQNFSRLGSRVVCVRTGLVLGKGGVLDRLYWPYQLGLGGPLGTGQQWVSWIHVLDLVSLYIRALEDESMEGPVHGVSSFPIRQRDFAQCLGKVLHRPSFLPLPAWVLRLLLGEMSAILLSSQRVLPSVSDLKFSDLQTSLKSILK